MLSAAALLVGATGCGARGEASAECHDAQVGKTRRFQVEHELGAPAVKELTRAGGVRFQHLMWTDNDGQSLQHFFFTPNGVLARKGCDEH